MADKVRLSQLPPDDLDRIFKWLAAQDPVSPPVQLALREWRKDILRWQFDHAYREQAPSERLEPVETGPGRHGPPVGTEAPVMIDWLSVRAPECFDGPVSGGHVMKVCPDGEIEWVSHSKRRIEGSHQSSMMVRQLQADHGDKSHGCLIQGNPAKFLNGHNLFGSADATHLLTSTLDKIGAAIGQKPWPFDFGKSTLSRIDITGSWYVDRSEDALPFLEAMAERCHVPYRGRAVVSKNGPGTIYWGMKQEGERASPWQLKIYLKGLEVAKRPLHSEAMQIPGLLEDLTRTIRVELTLRTQELKRLNLTRVQDFTPEVCERVWKEYVGRIDFGDDTMTLDRIDAMEAGLKPRLADALAAWKAGNDLSVGRSRSAFYALKKELRDACGVDISTSVPTSNVVPLRRVIVAKPAYRPVWADELQRVLNRVA